jgi:hypothetical protein
MFLQADTGGLLPLGYHMMEQHQPVVLQQPAIGTNRGIRHLNLQSTSRCRHKLAGIHMAVVLTTYLGAAEAS